jgi:hypothetical protein
LLAVSWITGDESSENALLISAVALAGCNVPSASADDCDTLASAISAKTRASIGRRANDIITLTHPATTEIDLGCPTRQHGSFIAVFWDKSVVPPAFFDFVASAGSVFTGVSEQEVRSKAEACLRAALSAINGSSEIIAGQFTYTCAGGRSYDGTSKVAIGRDP